MDWEEKWKRLWVLEGLRAVGVVGFFGFDGVGKMVVGICLREVMRVSFY